MRRWNVAALLSIALLGAGCLISKQVGEPRGALFPLPDEMRFHFDTGFNSAIVVARLLVPGIVALWILAAAKNKQKALLAAVPLLIGGAVWFNTGWTTLRHFHVDIDAMGIRLEVPPERERRILYADIEHAEATYEVHDARLGTTGAPDKPRSYAENLAILKEYSGLVMTLRDASTVTIDLGRLSVEQRGTLLRAITERAHLEEQPSR